MCVFIQVAREAHFSGQSYLNLALTGVPTLRNNFYASFSFRTEQKEGLMFYHQDQVGQASHICLLFLQTELLLSFLLSTFLKVFVFCVCVCVQDGLCQVLLKEGHVVVRAGDKEIKTHKTYNDDSSHYVSIYNDINGSVSRVLSFQTPA